MIGRGIIRGFRGSQGFAAASPHLAALLLFAALLVLAPAPHPAGAAQIGPSKFDHLTTGYELLGAHLNVPCESCHVGAIFKGTPRDCASCHSQGSRITATLQGAEPCLEFRPVRGLPYRGRLDAGLSFRSSRSSGRLRDLP